MGETEISLPSLGTAGIRHRRDTPLLLNIGAGVPGEKMTTMGLKVATSSDIDQATTPPANRAFKLSEAFVLIDGADLLIVTEGSFRVASVASYLRMLIAKADLRVGKAVFDLRKVTNCEKAAVLEREGIKELRLNTNMYRATHELDQILNEEQTVSSRMKSFVGLLKDMFAEDVGEAKRELLAQHWGEVQVNTVIKAQGGSRAEEIVLEAMKSVGEEVLEENDNSVDVTVVTQKGTEIHLGQVTPTQKIRLYRREGANDLVNVEVYSALTAYRDELISKNLWKR